MADSALKLASRADESLRRDEARPLNGATHLSAVAAHSAAEYEYEYDSASSANQDCDTLLWAIESRLRTTANHTVADVGLAKIRAIVLECVEALEQVHATLARERQLHGQLHDVALATQAKLAQALAELAETRVDKRDAHHRALHDGLTQLPNRSFFRQRLDRALHFAPDAAPKLAVLYLDLDGMKVVNDTYGHIAGDQMLRVVASRLLRAVRGADMVSRQGGDEFALLLANLPDRDHVAQIAAKLFAAVASPMQIGTTELCVRASIGIAQYPHDGTTTDALLGNADVAMYHAKRQHSGYAFFDAMTGP